DRRCTPDRARSFPLAATSLRFDIRTNRRVAPVRAPRPEDAAHAGQHAFKVGGFLLQERPDMDARRGPRAAERDDLLDLRERQAEPTSLTDECEQPQHV